MPRQMVDEGAEVYRVVVRRKKILGPNPAYDWRHRENGELPDVYSETETVVSYYGPYNSEGVAKGQVKFRSQDSYGNPFFSVVSAHYEKANIVWEVKGQ
jgi:hypothetical protein